jgi:hypothetical protein
MYWFNKTKKLYTLFWGDKISLDINEFAEVGVKAIPEMLITIIETTNFLESYLGIDPIDELKKCVA